MSRTCKCMGENPNCYICGGRGIIDDISIADQTKTDWSVLAGGKKAEYSSRDDCTYGDEAHTSRVGKKKGLTRSCSKNRKPSGKIRGKKRKGTGRKEQISHAAVNVDDNSLSLSPGNFGHSQQQSNNLSPFSPFYRFAEAVSSQPTKQGNQSSTKNKKNKRDKFNNPFVGMREKLEQVVESGRNERLLDGARGFHNLRENGRFGSFPSFDGDDN